MHRARGGILAKGLAVTVLVVALVELLSSSTPPVRKVVLITIDTLRADRLGAYGYTRRPTTPNLDVWAETAVVFENAFAQAPWTVPSLGSLFAGRYPVEVGVYTNRGGISPDLATLPELFQRRGFRTASFNTHVLLVNKSGGFRRGFDEVYPPRLRPAKRAEHKIPWAETEPHLMRWLDKNATSERFFVWIHSMDPHAPPTVGNSYLGKPGWNDYDAEVRWVDAAVGRVLGKLDALGVRDETLVVLTADHGESLGERKVRGHQDVMYDEVLRVPLIVQLPGRKDPLRVSEPVELVDVFSTIADLADLVVPRVTRGESLVPLIDGRSKERDKPYLFHSRYHFENGHHELVVRDRNWKLLLRTAPRPRPKGAKRGFVERERPGHLLEPPAESKELYRWSADPGERINFVGKEGAEGQRLTDVLAAWWTVVGAPPDEPQQAAPELDTASLEALRALGYE